LKLNEWRSLHVHKRHVEEAKGLNPHARSSTLHVQHVAVYVAYDISEQRRRNRLHRLLRGFGEPVQQSVFLCWLDAVRQQRLDKLLDDFVRAPHKGQERIICIPARSGTLEVPAAQWVFE
jgi:CRISPR-associated endonuclease Cas2